MAYLHLVWWLLPPGLALWWARRWLLTPWARYVSHSPVLGQPKDKPPQWFITVRHVHWWPPFSDYDETYRSFATLNKYWWAKEKTGEQVTSEQDTRLLAMVHIADSRAKEMEELLRPSK